MEWEGKPVSSMRVRMLQNKADENIAGLVKGKFKRRSKK